MQQALELDDHPVGAAEDQVVDRPFPELVEGDVGGVLQVPVGDFVGVALHGRPPAPLGGMAAGLPRRRPGHGVEDLGVLGELAELEAEEPGPLPVDEHDGEAFVGLEDRLQWPDVGRVVDGDRVADG